MTKYTIKLYAKNKKTIDNFLKFFKRSQNTIKNFPIALNFKRKKKRKNIVTILKSPHVNKKAQTQFQRITYTTIGKYFSWGKKSMVYLKKFKNNLFPGLKIKIEKTFCVKNAPRITFNNKILLIKKTTALPFSLKKKQILTFENRKAIIDENQKWKKNILKNFKELDSYGFISRKN